MYLGHINLKVTWGQKRTTFFIFKKWYFVQECLLDMILLKEALSDYKQLLQISLRDKSYIFLLVFITKSTMS